MGWGETREVDGEQREEEGQENPGKARPQAKAFCTAEINPSANILHIFSYF